MNPMVVELLHYSYYEFIVPHQYGNQIDKYYALTQPCIKITNIHLGPKFWYKATTYQF